MSDGNIISIAQVRWYQEHAPEHLTALYTTVYDTKGVPSRIRAYKLDEHLQRGFLAAPPDDPTPDGAAVAPQAPPVPPPPRVGVMSNRVFPRRKAKPVEDA
ncbi:MAG: hypothetical protein IT318_20350 [Anaerolineales bacterium]|nr:hypothetical protein [Anaerolineales bacterium]